MPDTVKAYKCPSCGAFIDLMKLKKGVCRCEFCQQTFMIGDWERFQKALNALALGEMELNSKSFDRAYDAFKKASEENPNEPEAYFGMALAENSVQYLTDCVNDCLSPISYDVSAKKFSDNKNYKKALTLATSEQRAQYEKQSEDIDYIRKQFYNLKKSGEKYDCFICVKVTDDETRGRSPDYKYADDIYFDLKCKGFKPFFSERDLRDFSGIDYESRILYALHSAKCMIVVCGNEEYLRTPWVKNEYSRYLKLIGDEQKPSDSITIAFTGAPIERLEGKKGKIQGIDLRSHTAFESVREFVKRNKNSGDKGFTYDIVAEKEKKRVGVLRAILKGIASRKAKKLQKLEKIKAAELEKQRLEQEEIEHRKREILERERLEQEKYKDKFQIDDGRLIKYIGRSSARTIMVPGCIKTICEDAIVCYDLEVLHIAEGVETIENGAVSSQGLRQIVLPLSLKRLKGSPFYNCLYGGYCAPLIMYNGTSEDWKRVKKDSGWFLTEISDIEEVICKDDK